MTRCPPRGISIARGVSLAIACCALVGCATPSREAEEAARNTYACLLDGQRIVLRFEIDEVRMLMPGGERVTLYVIPTPATGNVRYANSRMELRGKGTALELLRDGTPSALVGCQPFAPPA